MNVLGMRCQKQAFFNFWTISSVQRNKFLFFEIVPHCAKPWKGDWNCFFCCDLNCLGISSKDLYTKTQIFVQKPNVYRRWTLTVSYNYMTANCLQLWKRITRKTEQCSLTHHPPFDNRHILTLEHVINILWNPCSGVRSYE